MILDADIRESEVDALRNAEVWQDVGDYAADDELVTAALDHFRQAEARGVDRPNLIESLIEIRRALLAGWVEADERAEPPRQRGRRRA